MHTKNIFDIKIFTIIAKKYGINELIKVYNNDDLCKLNGEDCYINTSYIIGKYRIELGIYNNDDLLIASFFHEIGHIYKTNKYYNTEEVAWDIGFNLLEDNGYIITNDMLNFKEKCLLTYKNINL